MTAKAETTAAPTKIVPTRKSYTRTTSGPKPINLLYRVYDMNGEPIPGAKAEFVSATTDSEMFVRELANNRDAEFAQVTPTQKPRQPRKPKDTSAE